MVKAETDPRSVVITGVGAVTSIGVTARETFLALLRGRSGIGPLSGFDTEGSVIQTGAQVKPLDHSGMGISPRDVRILGLQGLMLMKAAGDAFAGAGLDAGIVPGDEVGLFAGMGMKDYRFEALLPALRVSTNEDGSMNVAAFYSRGYREIYPLWPLSMLNNMALCQTGIGLGIKGENAVFAPYGDSGARALFEARAAVSEGRARVAMACGVSEEISPLSLARGLAAGMLKGAPEGPGGCLGEGCGVLVLESAASAEERGMLHMARLSGFGWAFGSDKGTGCPSANAMENAMMDAMAEAGISPARIDLIMDHRDGTLGDEKEMEALARVFSITGNPVNRYSSKPALGNLYAAAPLVDAVLSICAMGMVPEGDYSTNRTSENAPEVKPKCVLINTRSHQGVCASLVLSGG
jgi:3-oxoacyl-[acyl-carrier-protein] synthase II